MRCKNRKFRSGIGLVEVMVAILILSVAVIGASGYKYYAALDARKATIRITAARIGLLLCENWRGVKGAETYDPINHFGSDLPITASNGPAPLEDFTLLGSYTIVLNGFNYYATLSWKDVDAGLRALNVVVVFPLRGQEIVDFTGADKSFKLTTYTLN